VLKSIPNVAIINRFSSVFKKVVQFFTTFPDCLYQPEHLADAGIVEPTKKGNFEFV
jgi:hypothetical protein